MWSTVVGGLGRRMVRVEGGRVREERGEKGGKGIQLAHKRYRGGKICDIPWLSRKRSPRKRNTVGLKR